MHFRYLYAYTRILQSYVQMLTVLVMMAVHLSLASAQLHPFSLSRFDARYHLVWSDEFSVPGPPDPSNWAFDIGTGSGGWGNLETEYYTDRPENVAVRDGHLALTATSGVLDGTDTPTFFSGRIHSHGKRAFLNGLFVARARLPYGQGIWPAIWSLGSNIDSVGWPRCGELDIVRIV